MQNVYLDINVAVNVFFCKVHHKLRSETAAKPYTLHQDYTVVSDKIVVLLK